VRDVTIPSIHATPSFMVIMLTEAFAYHERDLRTRPELYGEVLREKLMVGGLFRADEYVQAQRLRAQIREDTARALETVDVLITPTALGPAPAFKVVHDPDFPFAKSNMGPFNITGLPTLAIPTGFSSSGLPLSMQISGRPFDEATVLRAGHAYQRATDWHRRRPPVAA
jgi:aspartyl-tRNA(Asn)/glutamyl-tRNA(Gln) amidotransferase subunit A